MEKTMTTVEVRTTIVYAICYDATFLGLNKSYSQLEVEVEVHSYKYKYKYF